MDYEYVREHYRVPACYGRRVTANGRAGVIARDEGHYIGVSFDDDKPGIRKQYALVLSASRSPCPRRRQV